MKKWLYSAVLGLAMAAAAGVQASDKIAVVDVSSIFKQLPERETIAKELENEFKDRASELKNIEQILQTKIQRLQRDGATMKTNDRTQLEKSVKMQRDLLSREAQDFAQDDRRRQIEERNKILSRIQAAIKSVASKKGFDVVIDTNAVAYVIASKDITTDVLKQVK